MEFISQSYPFLKSIVKERIYSIVYAKRHTCIIYVDTINKKKQSLQHEQHQRNSLQRHAPLKESKVAKKYFNGISENFSGDYHLCTELIHLYK